MAETPQLATRVVVVMGDYEWEFDNALVSIEANRVDIWYEEEDGERTRIATAPPGACLIEWVDLSELGAVEAEDDDEPHEHN